MKVCEICNVKFVRPKGCSFKLWERRSTCSKMCRIKRMGILKIGFKIGHPPYEGANKFPKKHKTWNKGMIGVQSWMNTSGLIHDGSNNRGKRMSLSQRNKLSRRKLGKPMFHTRGDKHWNWKGGRTKLRLKIMQTNAYRLWRSSVFERDSRTCQHCDSTTETLNADHIKPFSKIMDEHKILSVDEAKRCSELWDISNGRTLCVSCHKKTDTFGNKKRS